MWINWLREDCQILDAGKDLEQLLKKMDSEV